MQTSWEIKIVVGGQPTVAQITFGLVPEHTPYIPNECKTAKECVYLRRDKNKNKIFRQLFVLTCIRMGSAKHCLFVQSILVISAYEVYAKS